MTGPKFSSALIAMGMTGGIVSSTPFIQNLNENAAAYGLIISLCVGLLGVTAHFIIGLIRTRQERRHDDRMYDLAIQNSKDTVTALKGSQKS